MPKDRRPYAHNSTMRVPRAPMKKRNEERQQRRERDDLVYGSLHDWIGTQPCDVAGRQRSDGTIHVCGFYPDAEQPRPNVESHHIKTVGSGGQDRNNTVPLCPKAHDEAHSMPVSDWCRFYHRDFRSVSCDYTDRFDRENA